MHNNLYVQDIKLELII